MRVKVSRVVLGVAQIGPRIGPRVIGLDKAETAGFPGRPARTPCSRPPPRPPLASIQVRGGRDVPERPRTVNVNTTDIRALDDATAGPKRDPRQSHREVRLAASRARRSECTERPSAPPCRRGRWRPRRPPAAGEVERRLPPPMPAGARRASASSSRSTSQSLSGCSGRPVHAQPRSSDFSARWAGRRAEPASPAFDRAPRDEFRRVAALHRRGRRGPSSAAAGRRVESSRARAPHVVGDVDRPARSDDRVDTVQHVV
jgi:hypothetical protein